MSCTGATFRFYLVLFFLFTYFFSNIRSPNDSLGGLEFTIIDGQPHWKERGADSFNPFKSNIKYIDVVLDGMSEYTFNSSSISDTAEIVGAGIVSRDYSGWMGVEVEYTASTVTAKNNVNFTDNCILRIWYSDTIFKMGGIIKWEFPVISAGGTHTFTIPEDGEFTLYVMSSKGWGCENLSIYSTTIDNYTILSEYHSENSAVGHAYMILNINAKIGDTITFSHGISNGADTVPFYALTYR